MIKKVSKNVMRKARHKRIRENIRGTANVPRLSIYRSISNIFAQLIDDENGVTLVSASSIDKNSKLSNGSNIEAAKKVGELLAEKALKQNIKKIVFDRGGHLYHGRVKALAEAVRSKGLEF